jgi:hypothetical protein
LFFNDFKSTLRERSLKGIFGHKNLSTGKVKAKKAGLLKPCQKD